MGQQDDLCACRLGCAQGLQHIPGSTGIGDEQHHILRRHQAGRDQLQMAVARRAELGGNAGEPCADIVGDQHAAALTQTVHLPRLAQQLRGSVHRFRRERILCAVDGGHQQGTGVLTQGGRVGVRFRHTLVDQRTGGIGLCQRNAHFVVALKPQRPAEAEHGGLCHAAFLCQ